MTFVIPYPMIDPVLLQFGPVAIRWYSLAYIAGLLLAWRYMRALIKHPPAPASALDIDDFIVWATLGVVLGGRLGYVIFYKPEFYLDNPLLNPISVTSSLKNTTRAYPVDGGLSRISR